MLNIASHRKTIIVAAQYEAANTEYEIVTSGLFSVNHLGVLQTLFPLTIHTQPTHTTHIYGPVASKEISGGTSTLY